MRYRIRTASKTAQEGKTGKELQNHIHDMKKKVRFSLVYRDMWQSSGKFQPRKDQLARIAPVIIDMGCFARVETNGGAFEQVNLLAG